MKDVSKYRLIDADGYEIYFFVSDRKYFLPLFNDDYQGAEGLSLTPFNSLKALLAELRKENKEPFRIKNI